MEASWTKKWWEFKSPLRVVIQILLRSRKTIRRKYQEQTQELAAANRLLAQRLLELEEQGEVIGALKQQVRSLELEKQTAVIVLPDDPPLNGHGYGPRLVSLAVNLAQVAGLRGAERTMETMFEWLGVQQQIPHWTTIRNWIQRIGVAALREPLEQTDDRIWFVDHSNQIGAEKVLVGLAIRASQLPPAGQTIKHEDVRVLTVQPGTTWKREDMAAIYAELAEEYGAPRAILCDGAVELREGAEPLKNLRDDMIVLQDFKHKAANLLKALLGANERFAEFSTQLGQTRSAIQQTELSFLTPPSPKPKTRFMNLGALLEWGASILWLLEHPEAKARQWVTSERLEEKLGWLRSFADDLAMWRECQQVISKGLTFINEQGLFHGAAKRLRAEVTRSLTHTTSRHLARQLVRFVVAAERQLNQGERLPMSTEILESTFALYKQLEGQHSKGGFTSLLAGFAALLQKATKQTVKQAFTSVHVKDVQQWVRDNLGNTLTSKRIATYREFRKATRSATKLATTS